MNYLLEWGYKPRIGTIRLSMGFLKRDNLGYYEVDEPVVIHYCRKGLEYQITRVIRISTNEEVKYLPPMKSTRLQKIIGKLHKRANQEFKLSPDDAKQLNLIDTSQKYRR